MNNQKRVRPGAACLAMAGALFLMHPAIAPALEPRAAAAPHSVSPSHEQAIQELEEVTVRGTRLLDRIMALENRFYRLYNLLNKEDQYDISCTHWSQDTESERFNQRLCLVQFYVDAIEDEQNLQMVCAYPPCFQAPPADLIVMAREAEYRNHMQEVISSDPRLRTMNRERAALEREAEEVEASFREAQAQLRKVLRQRRFENCSRPTSSRMVTAPCSPGQSAPD
jgi:hypothetical protein